MTSVSSLWTRFVSPLSFLSHFYSVEEISIFLSLSVPLSLFFGPIFTSTGAIVSQWQDGIALHSCGQLWWALQHRFRFQFLFSKTIESSSKGDFESQPTKLQAADVVSYDSITFCAFFSWRSMSFQDSCWFHSFLYFRQYFSFRYDFV